MIRDLMFLIHEAKELFCCRPAAAHGLSPRCCDGGR
jgi:hypothetical protein